MITFPTTSPFKLLQPYQVGDAGIFFGRENETRQLAETLMRGKFTLLYGASGTGKTSLIQCGLPGMFSPRDWLPVFVRRNTNFIDSLREQVLEQYRRRFALRYPGRAVDIPADLTLRDAIQRLFLLAYVPVYLILDQFEEIFTLGKEAEQQAFFQALEELRLFEEDFFCKILIVTREEYIAHFYRYENALPFLFEHRFRVEKMREEQLLRAVEGTLAHSYEGYPPFAVDPGVPARILYNLTDKRGEVDLTTLQVYLDRLYREDVRRAGSGRDQLLFDDSLVDTKELTNVLSEFLDRQLAQIAERMAQPETGNLANALPTNEDLGLQILFKLVTSEGTKQSRSAGQIQQELEAGRISIALPVVQRYLDELAGPDSRVLTRLRYAKTGEERFEIAHDRLAEVVANNDSFRAREIRYREALSTIENAKKRFDEAAGRPKQQREAYLSLGELELVKQSLDEDRLENHHREFLEQSRRFHVRRRRRERWVILASVLAAVVFLGVAGVAWVFFMKANANEQKALHNLKRFEKEEFSRCLLDAETYLNSGDTVYAIAALDSAQVIRNDFFMDSIQWQGKIDTLRKKTVPAK